MTTALLKSVLFIKRLPFFFFFSLLWILSGLRSLYNKTRIYISIIPGNLNFQRFKKNSFFSVLKNLGIREVLWALKCSINFCPNILEKYFNLVYVSKVQSTWEIYIKVIIAGYDYVPCRSEFGKAFKIFCLKLQYLIIISCY